MNKLLTTKHFGLTLTALTLTATTAEAMNFAVSTQQVETITRLVSDPLPTVPPPSALGYVLVTGRVACDAGSVVVRLGGEAEAPGLTLVFHQGEALMAGDGVMVRDVAQVAGKGEFEFRLSVRNVSQPVRAARLETRGGGGEFETVARMDWPAPRWPHQEPMAWLAEGVATAGLAGECRISHFAVRHVAPGSLMVVR